MMAVKKLLKKQRSPMAKKRSNSVVKKQKKFVQKSEKSPVINKSKAKSLASQDLQFARALASNNKMKRDKTLKKLRVWIAIRSKSGLAFTEMDLMRLWKGLFFCMWMSDKPLIQEELAESISQLVHNFDSTKMLLLYTKCAFKTLSNEWFGIDQYRIDKFQMLARRILRQTFFVCKKQSWNLDLVKSVAKIIEDILMNEKCPLSYSCHITDIYCEELTKVSEGQIEETTVAEFLRPFVISLASKNDNRQIRHTVKQVFRYLIFQSDVGLDYKEKFEAWSKAGFPTGSIDAMEKVEISDEEDEEVEAMEDDDNDEEMSAAPETQKSYDIRAGRVDVVLSQLPFDPKGIVKLLEEHKFLPTSTPKTRKHINILIKDFNQIAQGQMPLGIKTVDLPQRKHKVLNPTKAAKRLLAFEDELFERKNKKLKKSAKNRVETVEETASEKTAVKPAKKPKNQKISTQTAENLKENCKKTPVTSVDKTSPEKPSAKTAKKSEKNSKKSAENLKENCKKISVASGDKTVDEISKKSPVKIGVKTPEKTAVKSPNKIAEKSPVTSVEKIADEISEKTPVKIGVKTAAKSPKKTPEKISVTSVDKIADETPKKTPVKIGVKTPEKTAVKSPNKIAEKTAVTSVDKIADEIEKTPVKVAVKTPEKTAVKSPNKIAGKISATNVNKTADEISEKTPVKIGFKTPEKTAVKTPNSIKDGTSSAKKRVKIMLTKNTAQKTSEYFRTLRMSPQVPFDGSKKPPPGVLKKGFILPPTNPWYRHS